MLLLSVFIGFHGVDVLADEGTTDNEIRGSVDIFSNETNVSDVMNVNEIVSDLSTREGISLEEAKEILFPGGNISLLNDSTKAATYRTITSNLPNSVGSVFYYCETSESGLFHAIQKVLHAGYNSGNKIYSGLFFYNLADPNRIDYILNGHLYNTGSTTISGGGEISVGESETISVGISNTSDYYAPLYVSDSTNF